MKCAKCLNEFSEGKILTKSYVSIREIFVCNDCFRGLPFIDGMSYRDYKKQVLLFSMEDCIPCKNVKKILSHKQDFFVVVNVNDDSGKELAKQYNIRSVPTFVVNGKIMENNEAIVYILNGCDDNLRCPECKSYNICSEESNSSMIMYYCNNCKVTFDFNGDVQGWYDNE